MRLNWPVKPQFTFCNLFSRRQTKSCREKLYSHSMFRMHMQSFRFHEYKTQNIKISIYSFKIIRTEQIIYFISTSFTD